MNLRTISMQRVLLSIMLVTVSSILLPSRVLDQDCGMMTMNEQSTPHNSLATAQTVNVPVTIQGGADPNQSGGGLTIRDDDIEDAYCFTVPAPHADSAGTHPTAALEEIYILRSIREQHEPIANWCSAARTGFEPFPTDAERFFSFWSLRLRPEDGRVVQAKDTRAGELHACFGATSERTRQNFYAEVKLGSISFRGNGECLALMTDFPEAGLFPVRCQLILSGLPAPYVGGLLTTNTITSKAAFGGDTDPHGYTQASVATIRLWKSK